MKLDKKILLFFFGIIILIPFVLGTEDPNVLSGSIGFSVSVEGGLLCHKWNSGASVQWIDYETPSIPSYRNVTGHNANCYNENGINEITGTSDDTCCPDRYDCNPIENLEDEIWGGTVYKCEYNGKQFCDEYNESESECNENGNGNPDVAWNTVLTIGEMCGRDRVDWIEGDFGEISCSNVTSCSCVWDSVARTCKTRQEMDHSCINSITGEETETFIGNCTWSIDIEEFVDNCESGGYQEITYHGAWTPAVEGEQPDPSCLDTVKQRIDCSSIILMGFFDEKMFIICVFLLLVIYLIQVIIHKK